MNSQSTKQLNLRPIYAVVAIGFSVLVVLIWWIGSSSSSKLYEISANARRGTNEYMDRLRLALNIQEAVTEVVAEARVYRARQGMRVPVPPFAARLKTAKNRFNDQIKEGKDKWGGQKEHETLTEEELAAWREVEKATQKFLDKLTEIENSPNEEDSINVSEPERPSEQIQKEPAQPGGQVQKEPAQPGGQVQKEPAQPGEQVQKEPAQPDPNDFYKLRSDLDHAAKRLTEAVTRVRNEILDRIVTQQQRAASEVKKTTQITMALGLFIAGLILIFAWNQIIQIRRSNRQEQEAKDFARSIFDSQSNDIIVVNYDGELRAVNQAFLNHFELPAPSLVLQDYRAALAHLPEVAAFVGKALAQPDDSSSLRERIEVRPQFSHNGQNAPDTRLFDVYTSPLTITGQPGGRVVVIVDVTEAEQVREELRRSRTLSAVGQITATVAHELYNPIGAVKLNLDLLEMQITGDGELNQTVARLRRGVEHLSTIVMDLRYLTRTRDPEPRTTDLNK